MVARLGTPPLQPPLHSCPLPPPPRVRSVPDAWRQGMTEDVGELLCWLGHHCSRRSDHHFTLRIRCHDRRGGGLHMPRKDVHGAVSEKYEGSERYHLDAMERHDQTQRLGRLPFARITRRQP